MFLLPFFSLSSLPKFQVWFQVERERQESVIDSFRPLTLDPVRMSRPEEITPRKLDTRGNRTGSQRVSGRRQTPKRVGWGEREKTTSLQTSENEDGG